MDTVVLIVEDVQRATLKRQCLQSSIIYLNSIVTDDIDVPIVAALILAHRTSLASGPDTIVQEEKSKKKKYVRLTAGNRKKLPYFE